MLAVHNVCILVRYRKPCFNKVFPPEVVDVFSRNKSVQLESNESALRVDGNSGFLWVVD